MKNRMGCVIVSRAGHSWLHFTLRLKVRPHHRERPNLTTGDYFEIGPKIYLFLKMLVFKDSRSLHFTLLYKRHRIYGLMKTSVFLVLEWNNLIPTLSQCWLMMMIGLARNSDFIEIFILTLLWLSADGWARVEYQRFAVACPCSLWCTPGVIKLKLLFRRIYLPTLCRLL